MYSYFSILSYTHNSLLIFCSSIYILPSSRISSTIKSTTWNSRFFFTCCTIHYWRSANITPSSMWNLLAKTATKLLLVCILFLLSLYNFEFLLGLLYFPREVFDMYEDLLYGFYSFPFKFSGKVLPVILILLFFSFISNMPTRLFFEWRKQKII